MQIHDKGHMTVETQYTSQIGGEPRDCPACDQEIEVFGNHIFLHPGGKRVTICFRCADKIFKDATPALVEGGSRGDQTT